MTVNKSQRRATATVDGQKIRLVRMPSALVRGCCPVCDLPTYVEANLGQLRCAHCGEPLPERCWGRIEPVFVPEGQHEC